MRGASGTCFFVAEPEKHEIEHGFKERQELVEVIARLRGRGAAGNNQSAG